MLPYILAIAIGLSSLILFGIAFFSPKIHRQDDFLWSGVGLFYALVLWLCAGRVTGAVLLGQTAAVILLISFGWQTLKLRRIFAYPEQQADLEGFSIMNWGQNRLGTVLGKKKPVSVPPESEPVAPPPPQTPVISQLEEEITQESVEIIEETPPENLETESITEQTQQPPDEPEKQEAPITQPKTTKKGFSLKGLFNFRKPQPKPETIEKALAEAEADNKDEQEWETETTKEQEPQEAVKVTFEQEREGEPNFLEVTSVDTSELEFEFFSADDQAETIIEKYQPNLGKPKPEEQALSSTVEEKEPQLSEPSDVKDEKLEKSEVEEKETHSSETSQGQDEKPEKSE